MRQTTFSDIEYSNRHRKTKREQFLDSMETIIPWGQWVALIQPGVDAGTGYVHTLTATSANIHDVEETTKLIRQDDTVVYGDSGYLGAQERIDGTESLPDIECRINKRPSSIKMNAAYDGFQWDRYMENRQSSGSN